MFLQSMTRAPGFSSRSVGTMHPSLSCLSCAGLPESFATYLPQHGAVAAGDAMGGGGRCHGRVHGRVSDAMAVSEDASVLPCACQPTVSAAGGGASRAERVCVWTHVGRAATHVYVRPAAAPRAASCRAFSASACSIGSDEGGPAAESRYIYIYDCQSVSASACSLRAKRRVGCGSAYRRGGRSRPRPITRKAARGREGRGSASADAAGAAPWDAPCTGP